MEEIDLKEIFNLLWKRKIDIIAIILLFIVLGSIYTFYFITPMYNSSVTMILVSSNKKEDENSTITTSDIQLNSKLVSTYTKLIKSKSVLDEVISNLGIEIDRKSLMNNISVSSIKNTELIEITVKNENNELSAQIANEIAKVFKEKVRQMYNINNIELMDEAGVETEPSNINHKENIIMFSGAGVIIAFSYILLLNMMDTTIKGPEMVEKEFELPVLASIPLLRR